jgi:hypothetical protein
MLSTPSAVIVLDNIFDQKTLSTSTWGLESGDKAPWQAVYPIHVRTGGAEWTSAPAIISATTNKWKCIPYSNTDFTADFFGK